MAYELSISNGEPLPIGVRGPLQRNGPGNTLVGDRKSVCTASATIILMESVLPGYGGVAFFGGSFDPPHLGHIAIARAAMKSLGLNQILFAPVGLQPLKPAGSSASFEHRVAMTRLAIANQPGFELSLLDAPNPAAPNPADPDPAGVSPGNTPNYTPNYTFDTLTKLRQSQPEHTPLFQLLGADSFRTMHHWYRAGELPFLASLIVASRPGEDLSHLPANLPPGVTIEAHPNQPNHYLLTSSAGDRSQLTILPGLNYDISATELRSQVHELSGKEPRLLDPAVLKYIRQHRLYEQS
jgi:nicotinate-nucleotide adenylyltransferase